MQLFRNLFQPPESLQGCVLAIGNFDGMHLGHRAVVEQALSLARDKAKPCVVMTFSPHPRQYFFPDTAPANIEPLTIRLRRMRELGVDGLMLARFNAALAEMSAESFVERLLVETLGVAHVVVGEDFHFGYRRQGDIRFLQDQAVRYRFGCTYVAPVIQSGEPVSSTRIRASLSRGRIDEVSGLLGRPYEIFSTVIHGEKRGRQMQAPTANLSLDGLHIPRYGVYAVRFAVGQRLTESSWQEGVANLGLRPTFGSHHTPLLEVHGLGNVPDLYGKRLRVRLVQHLRDEQRFESQDALMQQIQQDIQKAKLLLSEAGVADT